MLHMSSGRLNAWSVCELYSYHIFIFDCSLYCEECFFLGHLEGFAFSVHSANCFACAILSSRCLLLQVNLAASTKEHFERPSELVLFFAKQAGVFFVCYPPPPFFFILGFLLLCFTFLRCEFCLFDSRGKNWTHFCAILLKVELLWFFFVVLKALIPRNHCVSLSKRLLQVCFKSFELSVHLQQVH